MPLHQAEPGFDRSGKGLQGGAMGIHRRLVMTAAAVLACAVAGGGLAAAQSGHSGKSRQARHSLKSHVRRSGARRHRGHSGSGAALRSRRRHHHSGSAPGHRFRGHRHHAGSRSERRGDDRGWRGERRRRRCDGDDPFSDRDDAASRDDRFRGDDCSEAESGEVEGAETEETVEAPSSVATEAANFAG